MIQLLADQHLYKVEQFLPENVDLTLFDPGDGLPNLEGFDALIVQTVTKLNAKTVPQPPESLRFIGTASSGIDHIDVDYFTNEGINVVSAKGCNANAVAEYAMTALLLWREIIQPKKSIGMVGVIGAGKTGSAVINLLQRLGIECVAYDPPREEIDPDFTSATLDEVLDCNILTFHVPLIFNGKYPTHHWLDKEKVSGRNFNLIINAARGGVIDESALLNAYNAGNVQNFILDVWENEPDINPEMAEKAFIATPHIAGYSEQAKITATKMICSSLADFFSLKMNDSEYEFPSKLTKLPDNAQLKDLISELHPILGYDKALRDLLYKKDKAQLFRKLRTDFPYRFEYPFLEINQEILNEFPVLKNLGLKKST